MGYIRSFKDGNLRYIEVKTRAEEGEIRISSNEWKMAKRFGEQFWLYIVSFAKSETPKIDCIQNPFLKFKPDEDIYATGYMIPIDRWKKAM